MICPLKISPLFSAPEMSGGGNVLSFNEFSIRNHLQLESKFLMLYHILQLCCLCMNTNLARFVVTTKKEPKGKSLTREALLDFYHISTFGWCWRQNKRIIADHSSCVSLPINDFAGRRKHPAFNKQHRFKILLDLSCLQFQCQVRGQTKKWH